MAADEVAGRPYTKRERYRELADRFGRTEKSFEFRMQNISAVLDERGEAWIPGLKPASHVGAAVKRRIERLLDGGEITAGYRALMPSVRAWLINVAKSGTVVRYGDVMRVFGIDRFSLRHLMSALGHEARDRGEPIITALIVSAKTGRCSKGLGDEFGVEDDEAERRRVYVYWARANPEPLPPLDPGAPLAVRAARFVSVEARPEQAAFRDRVFRVCGERCVISACAVPEALDAAHKRGRGWRGHNRAEDGYLLRKDLHALYDAGLLTIDEGGVVRIDARIMEHYGTFQGRRVG